MSPAEVWVEFEAGGERRHRDMENAVIVAWNTANFNRANPTKPLPSLQKLLQGLRAKSRAVGQKQTPSEVRAVMEVMAAQFGLKVRKAKRRGR